MDSKISHFFSSFVIISSVSKAREDDLDDVKKSFHDGNVIAGLEKWLDFCFVNNEVSNNGIRGYFESCC